MSTESPREAASAEAARTQAYLSQRLFSVAAPELRSVLGSVRNELGGSVGQMPGSINEAFEGIRSGVNSDYDSALRSQGATLKQKALQSGEIGTDPGVNQAYLSAALTLEQDRAQAMRRLDFQKSQAGLSQYNSLLQLLGQGSGAALNLAQGFSGNQQSAIGNLSQSSQFGSTLGGAAAGASIGSSVYPGWGTAIGAVGGGIAGALSSP